MPTEPIDIPVRQKGAKAAARDIKGVGGAAAGASKGVKKLVGAMAALAGTAAIAGVLKSAVKLSAEMEVLGVRLKVLTGNAAGAQTVLKGINELATKTPFALDELGNTAASLAVIFKQDTDAVGEFTSIAADLAAAYGKPVKQIGENLQRAFSAGLGSADVLRDAGITAEILAITGASQAAELSQQDLAMALRAMASEGGMAFNAAAEAANTLDGSISNTGIAMSNFQRAIGDAASPAIVALLNEAIIPAFADLEGGVLDNRDAIAKMVVEGFGSFIDGAAKVLLKTADIVEGLEEIGITSKSLELAFLIMQSAFQAVFIGIDQAIANASVTITGFVGLVQSLGNVLGLISDETLLAQIDSFEKAKTNMIQSAIDNEAQLIILKDKIAAAAADVVTDEDVNAISDRLREMAGSVSDIGLRVVEAGNRLVEERAKREAQKGPGGSTGGGAGLSDVAKKGGKAGAAATKIDAAAAATAKAFNDKMMKAGADIFSGLLEGDGAAFAEGLSALVGDSLSKSLSGALQGAGLGEGLAGSLGGAIAGIGIDLVSKAISGGFSDSITSTPANASAHVDNLTERATRGVVVGPQGIAIAEVGNAISDASIETNGILERIASGIDSLVAGSGGGSSGGGGGGEDSEFVVATRSSNLVG